ncbi:MAG: EamA family transporter [Sneathiella sp.]|nr:EamA family transporter [Sneathiella sp.]
MTNQTAPTAGMSLINWLLLLFLSLLWGGSFFFNGVALQEIPVLTVVFSRVFLAALTLMLVLRIKGITFPMDKNILFAFMVMGLLNNLIPFYLIVSGQTMISSGLASVLNATTPLFTALVAHFLSGEESERLGPRRIAGILCGIGGVAILLGPSIGAVGFTGDQVIGQLAVLAATLSYGFGVVYTRKVSQTGLTPLVTATGQVTATSVMMLPLILLVDQPWTFMGNISGYIFLALGGLAVLSTALAYLVYFHLIGSAGSTNASLVTLVIPVSAILLGSLFLSEDVTPQMVLGMLVIALGLLIIDGRILRRFKQKSPA